MTKPSPDLLSLAVARVDYFAGCLGIRNPRSDRDVPILITRSAKLLLLSFGMSLNTFLILESPIGRGGSARIVRTKTWLVIEYQV